MSDADLQAARLRIRDRLYAAELALAALLVLLLAGPLLDWRRLTRSTVRPRRSSRSRSPLDLIAARAIAWIAIRKAGLADFSLLPQAPWTPFAQVMFASPLDFLLNALVIAGLVVLAVSSFTMWRVGPSPGHRRGGRRSAVDARRCSIAVQLVAGLSVAALVLAYEWFLRTHVSQTPVEIVRFSLGRLDPSRLPVIVGLIALNAAVVGLAIAALSAGVVAVGVSRSAPRLWRVRAMVVVAAARRSCFSASMRRTIARRSGRRVLVVASAAIAAWLMHRYRFVDRHGSQAMKLLLSFLAVALPSIILYPSLVDASERARRQLIETRYAPEVINQRQDLRSKLQKALVEINRIVALDDLVRASDPPVSGPPPTDAAFLVWSQTSLATERLTSSVELHNASGAMVSRFAMNLPDFTQPQPWSEPSCDWEMLEEVSPLFSEERRLLHAGTRAVRRRAAAAPDRWSCTRCSTTATCRSSRRRIRTWRWCVRSRGRKPRPRADVEFYVYGWSRRVLYSSGRGRAAADRRGVPARLRIAHAVLDDDQPRIEFARRVLPERSRRDLRARRPSGRTASATSSRKRSCSRSPSSCSSPPCSANMLFNLLVGRAPASGRALFAEVRASFYRKLFLAFVAAAIVPVLALALVSRAYMANLMLADIESEATRLATVASRVFQDLRAFVGQSAVADDLIVWLSRVVGAGRQHLRRPEPARVERAQPVCVGPAAEPHAGRGLSRDLHRRPAVVCRPRARRRARIPDCGDAGAARRPRGGADDSAGVAPAGNAGADRGARSPRAAGGGALHHARRRHRLLHGRAHRRSGQSPDARDPAHRARRSRCARARDLVGRIAAAGRCVQPDGRRSAAPARRARAHQSPGGVGRHGAAGRARHQEPADADPAERRAPAARASRSGQAARQRDRRVRRQHPRPGAAAAADLVGVLELRDVAGAAAGRYRSRRAGRGSRRAVSSGTRRPRGDRDARAAARCRTSASIGC